MAHYTVRMKEWTIPGLPLRGYHWQAAQPKGAVLLLHGYAEYAERYVQHYARLIPSLNAAGYDVYAYDQRGHGRSPGTRAVVDAHQLVEDHLAARQALYDLPLPLFAFGHSLGGLVTAASALRDPRGLRGVILSSPALLVGEHEPALLKKLSPLLGRLFPRLPVTDLDEDALSRVPAELAAHHADTRIYHGKVPALTAATMLGLSESLWPVTSWRLPTLLLHGENDKLADIRGSERFARQVGTSVTFHRYAGGYHELLNDHDAPQVRQALLSWLEAQKS